MRCEVAFSSDASEVLSMAAPFLRSRPVEHNVILTLLHGRVAHPEPGRYWTVTRGGGPVGVVFQSPLDFPATITPMDGDATAAAVDAIAGDELRLPGVSGEAGTAARFAGQWTERCGSAAAPVAGQRIYRLGRLRQPAGVPGTLRQATAEDRATLVDWLVRFREDTGEPGADPAQTVDRRVPQGQFWVWEDGEPVSMVANADPVEGVTRLQAVYTPTDRRRHGYAGAAVGALSARLLEQGLQCMLYTDLANPTSNSVYRRLGYEAVCEVLRYELSSGTPTLPAR